MVLNIIVRKIKNEIARDFLALGSWVFYALVIGRALIEPFRPFVDQLIIAGFSIAVIGRMIEHDEYIARALVLAFFTGAFYQDVIYSGFAFMAVIGVVASAKYIKREWNEILKGIIIGAISIFIGYYVPFTYF